MPACLLALGSNLGDPSTLLEAAQHQLACLPATRLLAASPLLETAAVGGPPGQQSFLNSSILLQTQLGVQRMLKETDRIENELGRQRRERWGPRRIDIDILLYDNLVIDSPSLVVPHPRMTFRMFVLQPACQIAAHLLHPLCGARLGQLSQHLSASLPYLAVCGPGAEVLVERLSQLPGHRVLSDFDPADPQAAEQLLAAKPASDSGWIITNGWVDQLLLDPADRRRCGQWPAAQQALPAPRLVVVVEPAEGDQRRAWRQLARRPHQLPVLALPAGDPDAQMVEIEAALAAAQ